jgi:arsenate reductase
LPDRPVTAHWRLADPAAVAGDAVTREAAFWEVLTTLGRRIDLLCSLPDEKLRGMSLQIGLDEVQLDEGPRAGSGR